MTSATKTPAKNLKSQKSQKKYSVKPALGTKGLPPRDVFAPYPDLLAHLLHHRGIADVESAEAFMNPDYERDSHDPFLLAGMEKAVERILRAIKHEEKTVIYSDYDTDGIPAGVALHDFFKKIGFKNFTNYIPHRHDEGFGLNADAIEEFADSNTGGGKVQLLITIDCGIADVDHVALAQSKGIDVIVTDHHIPGPVLPPAYAIVNPKQPGCAYPEKMLCGAGVIYKVIQALIIRERAMRERGEAIFAQPVSVGWEKWLLDMIGIATLSDMVPLTGENRVFAHYGLLVLRKSPRRGLMKLLSKLKVNQKHLAEVDIGFTIGPRINAASRMGVPMDAFRLLATDDDTEAEYFAEHLNAINDERKGTVAALVKEVKHIIRERYDNAPVGAIVAGNPEWRPSLVGLAANTCAEEYRRPVFLWGRDGDGVIKGSCRSDGVTDLVELMRGTPEGTFIQFGGHAQSGGFAVADDAIHTLEERINASFKKGGGGLSGEQGAVREIFVDAELPLDRVTWETYRSIEKLAPFGTGNPKPVFIFKDVAPTIVKTFGKTANHTELLFEQKNGKLSAIGFFKNPEHWKEELGRELKPGTPLTLVATFEKSMFRGRPELRLRIVDIV